MDRIQQNGKTLTAVDASGNVWTKFGESDWHLVKGLITTPEGIQVGGFSPATVTGYYDSSGAFHPGSSNSDVGVINPVTGQAWSGNQGTMAQLVSDAIVPPYTTPDGSVFSSCSQLAAADPLRRHGALWTQCDANAAWRNRFLYNNEDTGIKQQAALDASVQKQAAAAQAAINALQYQISSGAKTPEEIAMYMQNIKEYQQVVQDAVTQGGTIPTSANIPTLPSTPTVPTTPAGTQDAQQVLKNLFGDQFTNPLTGNQVNISSANDVATTVQAGTQLNTAQRYTIYDILMAGATRAP
jgi:hypothetical protein